MVHWWFKFGALHLCAMIPFQKGVPQHSKSAIQTQALILHLPKNQPCFPLPFAIQFLRPNKKSTKKHLKETDPNPSYSQFPKWRSWNLLDFALKGFQFNFKEPKLQIQRQFLSSFFSLHVPMGFSYIAQLQLFQMRATWWLLLPVRVDWLGGGEFLSLIFTSSDIHSFFCQGTHVLWSLSNNQSWSVDHLFFCGRHPLGFINNYMQNTSRLSWAQKTSAHQTSPGQHSLSKSIPLDWYLHHVGQFGD